MASNGDDDPTVLLPRTGKNPLRPEVTPGARVRYFGDYEILSEIARGGMGVVFRARQVSLDRVVAVKMIHGGALSNPSEIKRFTREAQAVAQLDHPSIVPIYEVGEHEGQHYYSMKLIEGESLAGTSRREPLGPRMIAAVLISVSKAIHLAHQHGIEDGHRDPRFSDKQLL